jgi:hypothetical protein
VPPQAVARGAFRSSSHAWARLLSVFMDSCVCMISNSQIRNFHSARSRYESVAPPDDVFARPQAAAAGGAVRRRCRGAQQLVNTLSNVSVRRSHHSASTNGSGRSRGNVRRRRGRTLRRSGTGRHIARGDGWRRRVPRARAHDLPIGPRVAPSGGHANFNHPWRGAGGIFDSARV